MEKETSDTRTLLEEISKILMIVHLTLEEWKKDLEIQKGFFCFVLDKRSALPAALQSKTIKVQAEQLKICIKTYEISLPEFSMYSNGDIKKTSLKLEILIILSLICLLYEFTVLLSPSIGGKESQGFIWKMLFKTFRNKYLGSGHELKAFISGQ